MIKCSVILLNLSRVPLRFTPTYSLNRHDLDSEQVSNLFVINGMLRSYTLTKVLNR